MMLASIKKLFSVQIAFKNKHNKNLTNDFIKKNTSKNYVREGKVLLWKLD